jgi:hypothetical protein
VIDAHSAYEISAHERDEIMSTFSELCEIYSAVIDQLTIVEVIAIVRDKTDDHESELYYIVDVSKCDDCADIRAKLDLEHVLTLKFSTIEQVRALLVQLAITVSY